MDLEHSGKDRPREGDDAGEVPEWHCEVLDKRLSDYRSGKVKSITLEELERRLARP